MDIRALYINLYSDSSISWSQRVPPKRNLTLKTTIALQRALFDQKICFQRMIAKFSMTERALRDWIESILLLRLSKPYASDDSGRVRSSLLSFSPSTHTPYVLSLPPLPSSLETSGPDIVSHLVSRNPRSARLSNPFFHSRPSSGYGPCRLR